MIGLRPVFYINGLLLLILAGMMLLPALIDYHEGHDDWKVFFLSAFITSAVGGGLYFSNHGIVTHVSLRQSFLLTATSWIVIPAFAALPLYLAELGLSYAGAFFEVTSGLTTTGATVVSGLDNAPKGILLWRALLIALGGIGVVVLAMAVLPQLGVGGMQLFRRESSDTSGRVVPRARQLTKIIGMTYASLASMIALGFWFFGMSGFDAICHAFAALSTGGFSTHDLSFAYFDSVELEIIAMLGMLAGSLPLILYYQLLQGHAESFLMNSQVRWFLGIVLFCILTLSIWQHGANGMPFGLALRYASFNVISVISTTGFVSTDYNLWGHFAVFFFFMLLSVGACTGSTTGGIKIFRFQILYEAAVAQINRLIQPNGVFVPRYEGRQISPELLNSVLSFFVFYALVFLVGGALLSLTGMDFISAMSSTAQAMANVGPGLGEAYGPVDNYAAAPASALWVMSALMIIGRLELFTILVLLSPRFWRD